MKICKLVAFPWLREMRMSCSKALYDLIPALFPSLLFCWTLGFTPPLSSSLLAKVYCRTLAQTFLLPGMFSPLSFRPKEWLLTEHVHGYPSVISAPPCGPPPLYGLLPALFLSTLELPTSSSISYINCPVDLFLAHTWIHLTYCS